MSKALALLGADSPIYPERPESVARTWLEERSDRLFGSMSRRLKAWRAARSGIVALVRRREPACAQLELPGVQQAARELSKSLRRDGLVPASAAQAFALVGQAAQLTLGMKPFDVQLLGAWALLQGMVAEMHTGEGKTLTATLPACAMALSGVPVHVITVNDYLVRRDAEQMGPIYAALGLTVGIVTEDQQPHERQAAYACHIVYATNKTIVFDYLRDRIQLGGKTDTLRLQIDKLAGAQSKVRRLLLRGLSFAIVDEADSVLVDEARTPLIISAPSDAGDEARVAVQGIALAQQLREGADYTVRADQRLVQLTDAGRQTVARLCEALGGVWAGLLRREELAVQALSALQLFHRDEHYLVRDDKIQIVDEYTGRVMADRTWERGLHQLIEAKEGCSVTAQKEPLARISYQRFFRRYQHLAGMSGTAREVQGELGYIYGLPVVSVPTNRPSRRQTRAERVYPTEAEKWQAIGERIQEIHRSGCPVLLGTPSVAASERASAMLQRLHLPHEVLNAKQDSSEAEIVAAAGQPGRITIATNMAGRGTDIKISPQVAALGGLHVILSERHDSKRIDRQLAGRCARQGDPGVFEVILSMEDALLKQLGKRTLAGITAAAIQRRSGPLARWAGVLFIRFSQRRVERAHSQIRQALLKLDQQVGNLLAFSGRPE